jgi:predicted HAD superfamily Cof-like phosphohydrolase
MKTNLNADIFGVKSNHTNFSRVSDFMLAFGQYVRTKPKLDDSVSDLRFELIDEEVKELREGIDNQDLIEVADALTDILYVVYGAGHAYGIDLDKCFEEVHRSNMSKLGADGRPIYREDGKVLKGPDYFKPDLKKILYHDD